VFALLAACDGGGSRVAPGTTAGPWNPGTPDGTVPCDSGCDASPYFEVTYLTWQAYFGYDPVRREVMPVWTPYGAIEPAFDLLLGEPKWEKSGFDVGETDAYCLIQLPLTDGDRPALLPPSLWHGVGYTGAAPIGTCGSPGYELDPYFWSSDPMSSLAYMDGWWGAGIGELSPDAAAIIASAVAPEDVPYIFGGVLAVPLLTTGLDYDVYALGFVLDDNDVLHLGNDGTLDAFLADDVRTGSAEIAAWYTVTALYIYVIGP